MLVSALIASVAAYFLFRKADCGNVLSGVLAIFVVFPMATYVAYVFIRDCDLSHLLKASLERDLSAAERATLKATDLVCSTGYTFVRDGKVHTAIVVAGLFRPKIFVGNDTSP
jgi:hypothetical protein